MAKVWHNLKRYRQLYILLIPGVFHYILFRYVPLSGLVIAFQNFDLWDGIRGSDWVGFYHFINLFNSTQFFELIRNTLLLGFYTLLFGMSVPILFAIILNEIKAPRYKKLVQSISFFPSLISVVVVSSMVIDFLSPSVGMVNSFLAHMGLERHYFMIDPNWFRTIYVTSEVWQQFGRTAIIFFAALSGISQELYEAADIDGCGRIKRIWHITLPGLLPTICIMLILNAGNMFRIGADRVLLLENPMTREVADIFGSFVYRTAILEGRFSLAAAAGLFEGVVAFAFVFFFNRLSKRLTDNSLW